jgi:hypothetical protein
MQTVLSSHCSWHGRSGRRDDAPPGGLVLLVAAVVFCGCGQPGTSPPAAKQQADGQQQQSVRLLIDWGTEEKQREADIPWKDGMTALDALLSLDSPDLAVRHRGRGMTAFVEAIGGVENTGSGKNWLFFVNDQMSEKGAGVVELKAGDTVLWKYSAEK